MAIISVLDDGLIEKSKSVLYVASFGHGATLRS